MGVFVFSGFFRRRGICWPLQSIGMLAHWCHTDTLLLKKCLGVLSCCQVYIELTHWFWVDYREIYNMTVLPSFCYVQVVLTSWLQYTYAATDHNSPCLTRPWYDLFANMDPLFLCIVVVVAFTYKILISTAPVTSTWCFTPSHQYYYYCSSYRYYQYCQINWAVKPMIVPSSRSVIVSVLAWIVKNLHFHWQAGINAFVCLSVSLFWSFYSDFLLLLLCLVCLFCLLRFVVITVEDIRHWNKAHLF